MALFLVLVGFQLAPALLRGGLVGVREHIERIAIAGVPPEQWPAAIERMYTVLIAAAVVGCVLFVAQRYLGRKLSRSGLYKYPPKSA